MTRAFSSVVASTPPAPHRRCQELDDCAACHQQAFDARNREAAIERNREALRDVIDEAGALMATMSTGARIWRRDHPHATAELSFEDDGVEKTGAASATRQSRGTATTTTPSPPTSTP